MNHNNRYEAHERLRSCLRVVRYAPVGGMVRVRVNFFLSACGESGEYGGGSIKCKAYHTAKLKTTIIITASIFPAIVLKIEKIVIKYLKFLCCHAYFFCAEFCQCVLRFYIFSKCPISRFAFFVLQFSIRIRV